MHGSICDLLVTFVGQVGDDEEAECVGVELEVPEPLVLETRVAPTRRVRETETCRASMTSTTRGLADAIEEYLNRSGENAVTLRSPLGSR